MLANIGVSALKIACQDAKILVVLAKMQKFRLKLSDDLYRFWCYGKKLDLSTTNVMWIMCLILLDLTETAQNAD